MKEDLGIKFNTVNDKITVDFALSIVNKLKDIKEKNEIKFVHGKGKRKSKLQKYFE